MAKAKQTSTTDKSQTADAKFQGKEAFEKAASQETPPRTGARVKNEQDPSDPEDSKTADEAMRKMFGSSDLDFVHGLFRQLSIASLVDGKSSELNFNFSAAVFRGVQPKDPLESMLVAQMVTVNKVMSGQTLELAHCKDAARSGELVSGINKCARTYTIQLEARKQYRAKVEPQVTVQNVTVAQGGQAIVGDVHQQKTAGARMSAPPPALTHSADIPMEPLAEVPKELVVAKRSSRS